MSGTCFFSQFIEKHLQRKELAIFLSGATLWTIWTFINEKKNNINKCIIILQKNNNTIPVAKFMKKKDTHFFKTQNYTRTL